MPTAALATLTAGLLFAAPAAASTVLYDTLGMIDNATYSSFVDSYIGGIAWNGQLRDSQATDDFTLDASYNITSVTGAFLGNPGTSPPAHGVLVEFFADINGSPSNSAFAAVLSSMVTVNPFEDIVFGTNTAFVSVNLTGAGITLGPGTWWMSIQPVDETENGARWRWIQSNALSGNAVHVRNGGVAHGNGYPGGFPISNWVSADLLPPVGSGDLAMQIQGTLIPAPGALALLGLASLFGRRRR